MIRVTEIAFTAYAVTDMARSRRFYEEILHLKPTLVESNESGEFVEYEIGAGTFAICRWPQAFPSKDGAQVALEVDDFDGAVAYLKEQNVTFAMEPFPTPVCRMALIQDPDGSSIWIHKRTAAHTS